MKEMRFKSYLFDFLGAMGKARNLSMTVYMLLNAWLSVGLLFAALEGFFPGEELLCGGLSVGLYLLSLAVMLSPVGEWLMREQMDVIPLESCKPTPGLDRLEGIFAKVLVRAKGQNPNLEEDIRLFLMEDDSLNAFAMGRKTIVLHTGSLGLPNDQIAAILAHEVGHISHKDTDLRLAVTVGNVFVSLGFWVTRLAVAAMDFLVGILGSGAAILQLVGMVFSLAATALTLFISLMERIWFFLGKLAINYASRRQEFAADEFSVDCGCGAPLSRFLTHLLLEEAPDARRDNPLAAFMSTHPEIRLRLLALEKLGIPRGRQLENKAHNGVGG